MPLIVEKTYLQDNRTITAKGVVAVLVPETEEIARLVSAFGLAEGRRRSLGMVSQMGAELARGATSLYELENWYAGAALVRQLIEIEYLLWLFANDPSEIDCWKLTSAEDARRTFSPPEMRRRSNGHFDADEYSMHCSLGGHPRKSGVVLLQDWLTVVDGQANESVVPVELWCDLAQHVIRAWRSFARGVELYSPSNVYPDRIARVEAALGESKLNA